LLRPAAIGRPAAASTRQARVRQRASRDRQPLVLPRIWALRATRPIAWAWRVIGPCFDRRRAVIGARGGFTQRRASFAGIGGMVVSNGTAYWATLEARAAIAEGTPHGQLMQRRGEESRRGANGTDDARSSATPAPDSGQREHPSRVSNVSAVPPGCRQEGPDGGAIRPSRSDAEDDQRRSGSASLALREQSILPHPPSRGRGGWQAPRPARPCRSRLLSARGHDDRLRQPRPEARQAWADPDRRTAG
jgi:hypothetical protein